jgi:hypothetical protein
MPTCIVVLSCFYKIRRGGSPTCFSSNILLCNWAKILKLGHGTSLSKTSEVITSAPKMPAEYFQPCHESFQEEEIRIVQLCLASKSEFGPSTHEHHSWRSLLASCRRHLAAQSTAKRDRLVLPLHCSGSVLIWR